MRQLRDLGFEKTRVNTVLYAISFINNLSQLKRFRYTLIDETSSNVCIASSLGLNGVLFSTIQHQDPLGNLVRFIVALRKMQGEDLTIFKSTPEEDLYYLLNPSSLHDDFALDKKMKLIINPFYSLRTGENILGLLGLDTTSISPDTLSDCLGILEKYIDGSHSILKVR